MSLQQAIVGKRNGASGNFNRNGYTTRPYTAYTRLEGASMNIKIASAPVSWGVIMKDTADVPPWNTVLQEN